MIITNIKERTAERADELRELPEIYGERFNEYLEQLYPGIDHNYFCRIFRFLILNKGKLSPADEYSALELYIGIGGVPNKCLIVKNETSDTKSDIELIMKFADKYKEKFQKGDTFGSILDHDDENIFGMTPSMRANFVRQTSTLPYGKTAKTTFKSR